MLVSFIVLLTAFAGDVQANLAAEPSGGIAVEGDHATFLKTADVFIDVKEESATGAGRYMLFNPSNETEFLTICFDSGTISSNVSVKKDGFWVVAEQGTITSYMDYYWGEVFDVAMYPNTHTNITVDWEFHIVEDGSTLYTHGTSYVARYLIIGTAGWNHTIDHVNVTFRLDSIHFRSFSADSGFTTYDMDGAKAISYEFTEFDGQEHELVIRGDSITWDIRAVCCTVLLVILVGVVGVTLYLKKRKRDKGN